jgi:uracil-DNA glycosylase
VDAREQLRRYLEHRRDAGETELVLDRLTVDEVLLLLGAPGQPAGPAEPRSPTRDATSAIRGPAASETSTELPSADWREVLRKSGAAREEALPPVAGRPAPTAGPAEPPPPQPAERAGTADFAGPAGIAPPGLVVGAADRELFASMTHLESLDAVASAVASCTRCPLHATALNPVPGVGNPDADLMIVGEAPGATEDERGEPFVGAAGQLLTKILAAVQLRREDVFICNVLKHRPPGNRNPMPDEVTACRPYLFRQFELVRPRAILALGTFAAQTLLETKLTIGKLRTQVHRFHGVPLIVTYHPAALLRNPSWKRPTWEDVQLVRRILDSSVAKP